MWEYLEEEAFDHPGSPADLWYQDMINTYGALEYFPHIGCGARYVPYKKGPSKVCEILMGCGWEAFLADHTPEALDDQLKKVSYDALSRAFGKISPECLLKAIPMTMPMTHIATVNGKKMEGVAKYPMDAWVAAGDPCFTTEKWAMMCMMIAEIGKEMTDVTVQDIQVFERLFTVSTSMQRTL